jgi:hypothetical protein
MRIHCPSTGHLRSWDVRLISDRLQIATRTYLRHVVQLVQPSYLGKLRVLSRSRKWQQCTFPSVAICYDRYVVCTHRDGISPTKIFGNPPARSARKPVRDKNASVQISYQVTMHYVNHVGGIGRTRIHAHSMVYQKKDCDPSRLFTRLLDRAESDHKGDETECTTGIILLQCASR